jgi:hypothetical protein
MLQDEPSSVHEVLELVLSCTSDAALLCKATSLSTHYQQLSLARIRQNLPEILVHTVKQAASTAAGLQRQASWLIGECQHKGQVSLIPGHLDSCVLPATAAAY